jgi:hypothetical protein
MPPQQPTEDQFDALIFNWFTYDAMHSTEVLTNLHQNLPDASRAQ